MDGIKRDLFPILDNYKYFNTCSVGPLAKPVKESINKFMQLWDQQAGLSWNIKEGWMPTVEKARSQFAKLINAKPENVAYSFGLSVSISSITSAFPYNNNNEILFNELDFPATATHIMGKGSKVRHKIVKSSDKKGVTISIDDYKDTITSSTGLITACHVVSNTGFKIDETALIEIAHEKNIPVFLDAYQSVGYIPIDVRKNNIDFLASGTLKWLLGGFGISFLYIRDDWIEKLNPKSIGWMGVDQPFEDLFDKLRTTLHRPSDATKFQFGTPYPIGAYGASAGMKIIEDITINKINEQNMNLTQQIIDKSLDLGFEVKTPVEKEQRGSIVTIRVPNLDNQLIVEKLNDKHFVVDYRSNGIRISPHFYNSSMEIDELMLEIQNCSKNSN